MRFVYGTICHMLSRHCIGKIYFIGRLLSDILGAVWKLLFRCVLQHKFSWRNEHMPIFGK